ncbi:MAG: thiamine-phosphate kinase [Gammaproteobacteria bacterium]
MDEFALIARYFSPLGDAGADILCAIGDDAALIEPTAGRLAVVIDTLVEGVHFPSSITPADLGFRAAAVNLSDLAAMGARPRYATLALTLPSAEPAWLAAFAQGLGEALRPAGVALIGGDTTRGPLTVTVQILGLQDGPAMLRAGACVGDLVCVSGTLGDARAALDSLDAPARNPDVIEFARRYFRPQARLELGLALGTFAHAAIDISDGLIADLGHIAAASGIAIDIELERLPLSAALSRHYPRNTALAYAAGGGDDYELAFTLAPEHLAAAQAAAAACAVPITVIGAATVGRGVRCLADDGRDRAAEFCGFRHF